MLYSNEFVDLLVYCLSIYLGLAPSHQSAEWVFTEFQNYTGYENKGIVFFLVILVEFYLHFNSFSYSSILIITVSFS